MEPESVPRPKFVALILGAGDSLRMGQPKVSLRIQSQPVWLRLARTCIGAGAAKVIVLVGPDVIDSVKDQLPIGSDGNRRMQPECVPEKLRKQGPVGSIRHGLKVSGSAPGYLLWPVDHPFVAARTIDLLVESAGKIRLPRFEDKRGHPIYLEEPCIAELLPILERGYTVRDYVRGRVEDVVDVDVKDAAIHWNCDSPAAFRSWLEKFEQQQAASRRR